MIVIGKKNCKNYFVCLLVYSYSLKKKICERNKKNKINMCNLLYIIIYYYFMMCEILNYLKFLLEILYK